MREVDQFLFPAVHQRLDERQWGGLEAATKSGDEEKKDSATNGMGSRNSDNGDFSEFDSSHSSVRKGRPERRGKMKELTPPTVPLAAFPEEYRSRA